MVIYISRRGPRYTALKYDSLKNRENSFETSIPSLLRSLRQRVHTGVYLAIVHDTLDNPGRVLDILVDM